MNASNNRLKRIEEYMEDAKYSVSQKPYKGIYKVITIWIFTLIISELLLMFIVDIAKISGWVYKVNYYSIYSQFQIFLYIFAPALYLFCINMMKLRYREKSFLKTWAFVPIMIAFIKLYPLLIKYLNSEFLLSSYNVISYQWIIFIIGIVLIGNYREKSIYFITIAVNIFFIIFNLYLIIYIHNHAFMELGFISMISDGLFIVDKYYLYMLFLPCVMYLDNKYD